MRSTVCYSIAYFKILDIAIFIQTDRNADLLQTVTGKVSSIRIDTGK